ncbi:hypothetical protein [Bacillus sp. NSP9.1]|uniref:hypothetical protein n=1 Tax=Bacillus sp. NSP9.1 TaxID=1071078 RepID=UPI0006870312|nr:hypothetical protein [Bacillus sp. NSP9.1]QHZ46394.1 hypothetical protein M654_008835 [Bacillus sp. NSP9.1]
MIKYNENNRPIYEGRISSQFYPNPALTPTYNVYRYSQFQPLYYYPLGFSPSLSINYIPQNYMIPKNSIIPDKVSSLQKTSGRQDCLVTGGKGQRLDSGTVGIRVLDLEYIIYECAIEVKPKIAGLNTGGTYTLSATNTGIRAIWPITPEVTRYVFSAYVENKTLWVELEMQHRTIQGFPPRFVWRKTWGAKTKVGSWAGLKF